DTGYTTCPGDRLYAKLSVLRGGARRIGMPKIWDVSASSDEVRYPDMPVQLTADFSGLLDWTVTITDQLGTPVRTDNGTGDLFAYGWDGTDALGIPVAEGSYTITIAARDPATDGDALPATLSVLVLAPAL
ncbi:MAG TPA: FlgD immunoglobulin-like domain containing protein, partial [Actinomycetota bacterium]